MDDLISRQAAIDSIAELQARAASKTELTVISKAWKRLKAIPSAEVVEVVRCKDCRFYDGVAYCEMHLMDVNGNDFCSWAEVDQRRKEKK